MTDEIDLFKKPILLEQPPSSKRKSSAIHRAIPPIPETDWTMPTEFPDLSGAAMIAIDCESYDPDIEEMGPGVYRDAYISGVAVGTPEGFKKYYPIAQKMGPNCDKATVLKWLSRELSRPGQPKIGAHILYDLELLAASGVKLAGPFYDVQHAEPLLDENKMSYSLDSIAREHLGESKVDDVLKDWISRAFGPENWKGNIWRAPSSLVGPYGEGDVDLPLRIFAVQKPLLEKYKLWNIFKLESDLIPMMLAMRQRGVCVDLDRCEQVGRQLNAGYKDMLAGMNQEAGFAVEPNSPDSLARVFDKFGLTYPYTEKTNKPSFTKNFLENHPHPFAQKIVAVRKFSKLDSTFIKGIQKAQVNGRIHTQFHQLRSEGGGTVSGRFSSSTPNLQNIPSRDPIYGPLIRSIFVPEAGQRWYKFDWSQIEYRLIVHYACLLDLPMAWETARLFTDDPTTDFHELVAKMTGLPRKQAKNINFGIAYGQGLALLCAILGVDADEGRRILDEHAEKSPYIRKLSYRVQDRAKQRGFVTTMLGRRARFPLWEDHYGNLHTEYKPGYKRYRTHKALNALIQGTAADIMKKAMVDLWESGICDEIGVPHLTVHDELDGSIPPDKMHLLKDIQHIMENTVQLHLPMMAEYGTGPNWGAIE